MPQYKIFATIHPPQTAAHRRRWLDKQAPIPSTTSKPITRKANSANKMEFNGLYLVVFHFTLFTLYICELDFNSDDFTP